LKRKEPVNKPCWRGCSAIPPEWAGYARAQVRCASLLHDWIVAFDHGEGRRRRIGIVAHCFLVPIVTDLLVDCRRMAHHEAALLRRKLVQHAIVSSGVPVPKTGLHIVLAEFLIRAIRVIKHAPFLPWR